MRYFRTVILAAVFLLAAFQGKAQYVSAGFSLQRPDYVSRTHPGKLVVDYDRIYLDGRRLEDYQLPMEAYDGYLTGRRLYDISQGVAIGSVAAILAGSFMMGLSRTWPDKEALKAGPWLAGGGAVGLFAVAVPLDVIGLRKIRKTASEYNAHHQ